MRVTFCHHLSLTYGGGGEKWVTQLANELHSRGHEIEVRALPIWRKKFPILLHKDIPYTEKYIHDFSCDVAYVTYHPFAWLQFSTSSPKICGMHSYCYWQKIDLKYGLLPNLAHFFYTLFGKHDMKQYKLVHTVMKFNRIPHSNVVYIPNFVDSSVYRPVSAKHTNFTVGFASRKVWQKGYDIFCQLKELMPNVNFVETDNTPEDKMPEFYSKNHLTVVPARVDTFGLSIVESLLCGTPVITTKIPAHVALDLPLRYANTVEEFVDAINAFMSIYAGVGNTENYYRTFALRYDKERIINMLESLLAGCTK